MWVRWWRFTYTHRQRGDRGRSRHLPGPGDGLHVVVSDMNPNAPGFTLADDRLPVRTCDPEATLAARLSGGYFAATKFASARV